jgi:hypothetical protein
MYQYSDRLWTWRSNSNPGKNKVKLSLCSIKRHVTKKYGGAEVQLHTLLTSICQEINRLESEETHNVAYRSRMRTYLRTQVAHVILRCFMYRKIVNSSKVSTFRRNILLPSSGWFSEEVWHWPFLVTSMNVWVPHKEKFHYQPKYRQL